MGRLMENYVHSAYDIKVSVLIDRLVEVLTALTNINIYVYK